MAEMDARTVHAQRTGLAWARADVMHEAAGIARAVRGRRRIDAEVRLIELQQMVRSGADRWELDWARADWREAADEANGAMDVASAIETAAHEASMTALDVESERGDFMCPKCGVVVGGWVGPADPDDGPLDEDGPSLCGACIEAGS